MDTDLTRRSFLQYLGVVTAVAAVPGCIGEEERVRLQTAGGSLDVALSPTTYPVLRARDMLSVTIALGDLALQNGKLVTTGPGDGVLVLSFGPQHMLEGSTPGALPSPGTPVETRLAGGSRLAFRVAQGTEIDFELEAILEHCAAAIPNVSDSAKLNNPPQGAGGIEFPAGTTPEDALKILLERQRAAAAAAEVDDEPIFDDATGTPIEPAASETSIELPYRLALSPNDAARWSFAPSPPPIAPRAELWHARMRGRSARALWSYDPGFFPPGPLGLDELSDPPLLVNERVEIVNDKPLLRVRELMLSALGGSIDLRGDLADPGIIGWSHRATYGRDQVVRVEVLGEAAPWGPRTAIVKVFERKTNVPYHPNVAPPAGLRYRLDLVFLETVRDFSGEHGFFGSGRMLPFKSIAIQRRVFRDVQVAEPFGWIEYANGDPVRIPMVATDHAGNTIRFDACAVFTPHQDPGLVSGMKSLFESDDSRRTYSLGVQRLAFAPASKGDDTTVEARWLKFGMALKNEPPPSGYQSTPQAFAKNIAAPKRDYLPVIEEVEASIPSLRQVKGSDVIGTFKPAAHYVSVGIGTANNPGDVFLEVVGAPPIVEFGGRSERSGGAVNPDLQVRGLSRKVGAVPAKDAQALADIATSGQAGGLDLFGGLANARLFGAIPLTELLPKLDIDQMIPKFAQDALDAVGSFLAMVTRVKTAIDTAKAALDAAKSSPDLDAQAKLAFESAANTIKTKADAVKSAFEAIAATIQQLPVNPATAAEDLVDSNGHGQIEDLVVAIDGLTALTGDLLRVQKFQGLVESELRMLGRLVDEARGRVADANGFVEDAQRLMKAGQGITQGTTHLEWRPELKQIALPAIGPIFTPNNTKGLLLAADIRAKKIGDKPAGTDILFSLENFTVHVFGNGATAGVLDLHFKKLQFLMLAGKKPDVDVFFKDIEFKGPLAFIEPLRKIIPFDGFSDPPALTVDASGIKASFSQSLPNVAVGIFSLENISLGAELHMPFVGESLTFGLDFCTREKPCKLVVGFLGGGGHFGMKLGMSGLVRLELGLQFGASLSINLGVASGGISCMGGVTMVLESNKNVTLTAWFRARGELDVLGLISAAIEVYLALTYKTEPKPAGGTRQILEGEATLKIEVSIAFFSATVPLRFHRRFLGGNGDPTFADTVTPQHFDEYCAAFAA